MGPLPPDPSPSHETHGRSFYCAAKSNCNNGGMFTQPWLIYAVAAAVAAALTNLFARVGMSQIDSIFATTLRSGVMLLFTLAVCTRLGRWEHWRSLNRQSIIFITLSGVAGATSWLMGFKALSLASGTIWHVSSIDKLSVP